VGPVTRADTKASGRYDPVVNTSPEPPTVNRIRAARQALGWTQNELARKAGVSARTIHAIEKGRSCRQATKRSILNALGVPWNLREEYFQRALSVRRVSAIEAAHSA
jgi:DNA-binding XRE family transcriptional regulator